MPAVLVNVLQAHVSLQRIDDFLQEQETAKFSIIRAPVNGSEPLIGFVDGNFTWSDEQLANDDPSVFRIRDLNLSFPVGKLSIILGPGPSTPPPLWKARTDLSSSQWEAERARSSSVSSERRTSSRARRSSRRPSCARPASTQPS